MHTGYLTPSISKQDGAKFSNDSPLTRCFEFVAHLHRNDMKQTLASIDCDWLISNSMSKDDCRMMSKDSRYARNAENNALHKFKI